MKKSLILLLLLTGCASKKTVQTEQRQEHERIAAEWNDSLTVTFHDVVIWGTDTGGGGAPASARRQVKIKKIELTRKAEAKAEAQTEIAEEAHSEQTPQPAAGISWKWLAALAALVIWLKLIYRD